MIHTIAVFAYDVGLFDDASRRLAALERCRRATRATREWAAGNGRGKELRLLAPGYCVLIRPIVDADVDTLREMWRETWRDSYGARLGPGADAAIAVSLDGDAIRSMFAADGGCLVAVDSHALVGSICFVERQTIAYVWGLYVRPDRQGRGIGTALIREAAQAFTSAAWIDLSVVDDQALAFYRKLGFVEQGSGEVDLVQEFRVPTTRLVAAMGDLRVVPRPSFDNKSASED